MHTISTAVHVSHLDAGWEPIEDDEVDALPLCVGVTADGCEVVALHGREPILDDPDPEQLAEAEAVLRGLAGMG